MVSDGNMYTCWFRSWFFSGGEQMSDLIKREDAIAEMQTRLENARTWHMHTLDEDVKLRSEQAIATFTECILTLKKLPAAERNGHWESELASNGWKDIKCSECGWTKNVDVHVSLGYNYCPNCGARMIPQDIRDCDHCTHHTSQGCTKWDCEFERRIDDD